MHRKLVVLGLVLALLAAAFGLAFPRSLHAQEPPTVPGGTADLPDQGSLPVAAPTAPDAPDQVFPGPAFVHTSTSSSISANGTRIDHPATNEQPNQMLFVTPNWNPNGATGQYHDHAVGVYYVASPVSQWLIYNEDEIDMVAGSSFNVFVAPPSLAFRHTSTSSTTTDNSTILDDPRLNNNPNAIVLVTRVWTSSPGYQPRPIGVWYSGGRWLIFNQDGAPMPTDNTFNVLVPSSGAFVHRATASTIVNNWTYIDDPRLNNQPDAMLFVTPNWNPGGVGSTYNNHNIGVWYNASVGQWAIFNQDLANMPLNAAFNVFVGDYTTYLPMAIR